MEMSEQVLKMIKNRKDIECSVRKINEKYIGAITLSNQDGYAPLYYTKKFLTKAEALEAAKQKVKEIRNESS